jgi:hypothetical protein
MRFFTKGKYFPRPTGLCLPGRGKTPAPYFSSPEQEKFSGQVYRI